ncbi:hypothetical protein ACFU8I_33025 [Streptomyces sp. NPDC057540]
MPAREPALGTQAEQLLDCGPAQRGKARAYQYRRARRRRRRVFWFI